ncbi:MAG: dihydrofolate reductase family protein [Patescibacteria group bacterium]|nr:dihydrofolate reductase family protein [Patescibacteria group bacterium]MDD5294502.1 dihydrofolate reductase family protein [Patescibacteria group bacterium]MDD5555007.1 dihydrofolate reductase family protein [Patescibacteria group bacterium]
MIPVTMMMAITLDGKIAKHDKHFPDWTSKEDKKLFAKISKEHGVVMMGAKTFATFPAPLPGRLNVVFTLEKNPPKTEGVKWVTGEPEPVLKELEKMGYKSALLGGGAFLNSLFLEKKLISEIILTIEPKIFGDGLSLFNKDFGVNLKLEKMEKINDDAIMVKYKVIY